MSSVRSSKAIAGMLVVAVAVSALAGCSRGQPALDGTQWRLTEWTLSSLDAGGNESLIFEPAKR